MRQTHPINAALGAWLDALPLGTRLVVPVRVRWTALGISHAAVDGADDIALTLDDSAMGVSLLSRVQAAGGGPLLLEGTWGPLLPMPVPMPGRTLAVRRVRAGSAEVVSVINGE